MILFIFFLFFLPVKILIMKTIKGDLIKLAKEKKFDVIIHGCNCFNIMGAGIALQISKAFPSAYNTDQNSIKGDIFKLGTISIGYDVNSNVFIVNAYTQFKYGTSDIEVDYLALEQCFKQIKTLFSDKRIGYPAIGCGLAGGDWDIISKIIDNTLIGVDHTFVEWDI